MFGRRLGKPLTRARLSAASLKTLWIRETITREWLDQINEWLLSACELVWHPLEETIDGEQVKFYPDAEAVLAKLPRLGVPMILHKTRRGVAVLYSRGGMEKAVHKMRDELKLPAIFTLDACRHGGMTELDEAELTGRPGPCAVRPQDTTSLCGLREAND
jgi:hypothetical protein